MRWCWLVSCCPRATRSSVRRFAVQRTDSCLTSKEEMPLLALTQRFLDRRYLRLGLSSADPILILHDSRPLDLSASASAVLPRLPTEARLSIPATPPARTRSSWSLRSPWLRTPCQGHLAKAERGPRGWGSQENMWSANECAVNTWNQPAACLITLFKTCLAGPCGQNGRQEEGFAAQPQCNWQDIFLFLQGPHRLSPWSHWSHQLLEKKIFRNRNLRSPGECGLLGPRLSDRGPEAWIVNWGSEISTAS